MINCHCFMRSYLIRKITYIFKIKPDDTLVFELKDKEKFCPNG